MKLAQKLYHKGVFKRDDNMKYGIKFLVGLMISALLIVKWFERNKVINILFSLHLYLCKALLLLLQIVPSAVTADTTTSAQKEKNITMND